jgi:MFS family permease
LAPDPFSSLRFAEYRAFLGAMAAVFGATQIQTAVLGWQVYEMTGDPLALGFVGLAEAVPFLSLTLVGGWAADRIDRRLIALLSLAVIAASGAWLLTVSITPGRSPLPLYGAQALAGLGRAFFRPASASLGTELVPREQYQNAASWRSSIFHSTMIVGPALGGALIALGGPRLAYAVEMGLLGVGLAALLAVAARPRAPVAPRHPVAEIADGVRFVFREPLLLGPLSLDLFAVLFGGATALLPIFARDVLHVGEVGFGLLRAAPAVGAGGPPRARRGAWPGSDTSGAPAGPCSSASPSSGSPGSPSRSPEATGCRRPSWWPAERSTRSRWCCAARWSRPSRRRR